MWQIIKRICCAICGGKERDLPSPRDIIPQRNILYFQDTNRVVISGIKPKVWLTTVQDTNSMDPAVDAGHTCILTSDFRKGDLVDGDVVVYWNGKQDILHRIIKIEQDSEGRKYTLKGDNCYHADPYIVRDEHIKWLLLGIIY